VARLTLDVEVIETRGVDLRHGQRAALLVAAVREPGWSLPRQPVKGLGLK
jgi:hypothetical protein